MDTGLDWSRVITYPSDDDDSDDVDDGKSLGMDQSLTVLSSLS